MKKLLIVNNNMKVGGVQKSLCNLLWSLDPKEYEVTLLLFSKTGPYLHRLPDYVQVVECGGPFRYFGKSQGEYTGVGALVRGFWATISRLFGRGMAARMMLWGQPRWKESYDCAISFLHNGRRKSFYGGTQDYVLHRVTAERKVAWHHCDYLNCGANHRQNNRMLARFDTLVACSEGCLRSMVTALPDLADRCRVVRNCHRFDEIHLLAEEDPPIYDSSCINVVAVARLTHEKGLERAVRAVAVAQSQGLPVVLHFVGDGPMRRSLEELAEQEGVASMVVFHGQQENPYRYMKSADLLLLSSFHEAAPMVVEEARCLGLPVLTTATTSSQEMVLDAEAGWVCENDQEALNQLLCRVAGDREELARMREHLLNTVMDNREALEQFAAVVQG